VGGRLPEAGHPIRVHSRAMVRARPADYGRGGSSYASRYLDRVFKWLRDHPRLTDVAVVGGTAVLSVSLTGELGVVSALALGMAVILLANVLLGRLPSG
jgi:hypothetical protein